MERSCGRTKELAERRPGHVHAVLEGTRREGRWGAGRGATNGGGRVDGGWGGVIPADGVVSIVGIDRNRSFVVWRFRVAVQQHVAAVNSRLVRRPDRAGDSLNGSNSAGEIGGEAREIEETGQLGAGFACQALRLLCTNTVG